MKMTSYCGSPLMPMVPSLRQNANSGKSSRRIIFIICSGNQGAFCGTHAAISSRLQPEVLRIPHVLARHTLGKGRREHQRELHGAWLPRGPSSRNISVTHQITRLRLPSSSLRPWYPLCSPSRSPR